jgi:hypothetical protein
VAFELNERPISCAGREESRLLLIRTGATGFRDGGETPISAPDGTAVLLPGVMP